jgi:hypothetical protein
MNTSFNNVSLLSFYQWFDNYLLQNAQGYFNTSSRFYYQPDSGLPSNYVAYAAPFKSFVWDSGVSGAIIISSISGSLGNISRGQSGMMVDFVNGRLIFNSSVGKNAVISGSYAVKDFNLYFANQSQEQIVFTNKYYLNSRFNRSITGIPPVNAMVTPCAFITHADSENLPAAFGGLYKTKMGFTVNVFAENISQLEGILSYAADARDKVFPMLDATLWPLNSFGDYKSGYNYQTFLQNPPGAGLYVIEAAKVSKVSDYVKVDESIFLGIIDCDVTKLRTIH